jgi:hypothetical protein
MTHERSDLAALPLVYLIHTHAYADTRVLSNAATVAKADLHTTALAFSPDGSRPESDMVRTFSWRRQADRIVGCSQEVLGDCRQAPVGADLEPDDLTERPGPHRPGEGRASR